MVIDWRSGRYTRTSEYISAPEYTFVLGGGLSIQDFGTLGLSDNLRLPARRKMFRTQKREKLFKLPVREKLFRTQ